MGEYEDYDDFEDRFADELENLADFESQDSLPIQPPAKKKLQYPASSSASLPASSSVPPASQSAKNAAHDFFGGSQSSLAYPDDDEEEIEEATPSTRKRPTSGNATKSVEKRRRVDDDDEDDDQLVIDDSSANDDNHRRTVLSAINGDVPGRAINGLHAERFHRPSLSDVLKNKGRPLREGEESRRNGVDVNGFNAGSFPISSGSSTTKEIVGAALRNGHGTMEKENEEEDSARVTARKIQDNVERRRIRKHPPSTDDYVYLTEGDKGKRVYLAVKPDGEDEEASSELGFAVDEAAHGVVRRQKRQLLGVDYHALKRRVMMEVEARQSAIRVDEMDDVEEVSEVEMTESTEEGDKHNLWVEKYAPRGFTVRGAG